MDIKEYKADTHENVNHHPWEHARLEVVYANIKSVNKKKSPVIVDIGCGDAFFLRKLSKKMPEADLYGVDIELSDDMISEFSQNTDIKLFKNVKDLGKVQADIVLILDVMEHIEDDYRFLNEVLESDYIKDDTSIIITVPAFKGLYITRDTWLGHYRRYNLSMLKKLANTYNLSIVDLKYFFTSLFFARSLQKAIEIIRKPDIESLTGIGNYKKKGFIDFLFKNILYSDYQISNFISKTGLKLPGLSCMAILTKREL